MYKVQALPANYSSASEISPPSNAPAASESTQSVKFTNVDVGGKQDLVYFEVEADAFLRGMVRAIVGTVLKLHDREEDVNRLREILDARDRSAAGTSVSPHGLSLLSVKY